MTTIEKYFPQGIAVDNAFCNRVEEKSHLRNSILSNEHIVLVAPRRYGKTSLITQILKDIELPSTSMDFFFVLTHAEACKQITEGVSNLINTLLPKSKALCNTLIEGIKAFNPKLTINFFGQKLEIGTKQTTEKSISELLLALDYFAGKVNKTCAVVLDEFQQIGELKENHAIEAAIRHAVERSQHISYIFSGSKRHLLNEMFSNKTRPLYHLCDLMPLDRIEDKAYKLFFNKQAKKKWAAQIDDDTLSEILLLTENHPYYVNALCRKLWHNSLPPTLSQVRACWEEYVDSQAAWIMNDFSALTLSKRKIITALASKPIKEPQGVEFSEMTKLTPSSISKALLYLTRHDYVYKNRENHYCVFDPAIAYFIRKSI